MMPLVAGIAYVGLLSGLLWLVWLVWRDGSSDEPED